MVRSTSLSIGGIVISISLHLTIIISSHNILITAHDDTNISPKTNHLRTSKLSSKRRRKLQDDHKCKWHADQTYYDGCTNNNDIDDQWLDPSIYNLMFHSTSTECCNTFFQGVDNCVVRSDPSCDDYGEEESSCVSPGWHADNTERDGCSNGDSYPKEWLDESQISFMFLSTYEECCNIFYQNDDECIKYDKGCEIIDHSNFLPGGEMSNCDTKWHPDTIWNGCTNAKDDYPSDYNPGDSTLQSTFFFDTPNECCAAYHKSGSRPCQVRDACTDTTTFIEITNPPTNRPTFPPNECKWHPSTVGNTIEGSDKPQCSFSDEYPVMWNSFSSMYLFDAKEDCCKQALDSDDCDYVAICATDPPTGRPTTTRPSLEPSSSQVPSTLPPSSSPTVTYYVAHHTGECVLDSQSPKPYYITETFTDYYSCCEASHAKEACIASGPLITNSPTSVWPTISPRPTTLSPTHVSAYYVDHFTGICIDITGGSPPHYITETWPDYWTCCDNSFKRDECLRDGPTRIPTGAPTGTLSSMPSSVPTGEAPSQPPSEIRRPTGNPTTLLWGAYVAFSGPPSFRPTTEDCSQSSWHVEPNAQGCTNFDVHELGLADPVLLFSSSEECCSYSFESLDCSVRDVCRLSNSVISAEDNTQKETCNKVWHPDIDNMRDGCSNSHFPVSWHQSSIVMLFDSFEECCQNFYLDQGNHCKMYDYCSTESPTMEPTSPSSSPPSSQPMTTRDTYWYPDLDIGTCLKHDGTLLQPNLFTTFELCCKFDWMETATCLSLGQSR